MREYVRLIMTKSEAYDALDAMEHWRDELRDEIAPASDEAGDIDSATGQREIADTLDRICVRLLSTLELVL